MTKIIGYTLMILLAGCGAALSSSAGGEAGMWRGFILGSLLAFAIVVGDSLDTKNKLRQSIVGIVAGGLAGALIVLLKLKVHYGEVGMGFNSEPMIILLCIVYGLFFQRIIMSSSRVKYIKLFGVSFACIYMKSSSADSSFLDVKIVLIASAFVAANALLFTVLWYLPVWFFYVRKNSIASYFRCIPLNLRMLKLVWKERWLSKHDYAVSYDKVAATYDEQWLCQLRPVTEKLMNELLPAAGEGDILDLGCGTGFSTQFLEEKFPEASIVGVDISPEMLNIACKRCSRSEFVEGDILEFLKSRPDNSASMIFSGWAIGYSKPADIIFEASRLLKTGHTFAFVVNYSDTLAPVFYAFRKCMNKFPGQVKMALWPKFPHEAKNLLKLLQKNGFAPLMQEDGKIPIHCLEGEITLEWLLKTGVLAGFDQVMPLHDNPEIIEYFNKTLRESKEPVEHHYFMGVFIKK